MTAEHRRRYRLGCGFSAEFIFRPNDWRKGEVSMTVLACEWDPAPPRFERGNAFNKFLRRYRRARDDFLQECVQLIGEPMLNVELDEHDQLGEMTEFKPVVPS